MGKDTLNDTLENNWHKQTDSHLKNDLLMLIPCILSVLFRKKLLILNYKKNLSFLFIFIDLINVLKVVVGD